MMESIISHSLNYLGRRRSHGFDPGFIRVHAPTIAVAALAIPVLFDLTYAATHYKDISQSIRQVCSTTWADTKEYLWKSRWKIALAVTALALGVLSINMIGASVMMKSVVTIALNYQVPKIVYTGYSLMGLGHSCLAVWSYKERNTMAAIRHIFAACTSFATIRTMMTGLYEARWHHMSYGILSLVPGLTALSCFGTLMTLDSMLYWIKPSKDNFDFSNIFEDNLGAFVIQLVALSCFEIATNFLIKSSQKPTKDLLPVEMPKGR
ncbi:MAG: hypothetical protein Q8K75_05825 [Chlamydiales bacterium]|nr:hypothetical protein [Chlamydiales bacterium]